ncbi:hypothetical protein ECE50_004905 [Chitinophaga sp. Mgbs1]|uniref:DUF4276 family protein n=1 Tax=Chitinophaga solisilvae TaxID=1233460 RepID=A0A9Q5D6Y3_9BACT|nr:hypothetical protein [Chitinophaga solisilvae]
MMQMNIVGEDAVTRAIIKRLIKEYRPDIHIGAELPIRGGEIKRQSLIFNKLNEPVFILTDQDDAHCPPMMISAWFGTQIINKFMNFRIATTEAEVWLMADREGFAKWLRIDKNDIPKARPVNRRTGYIELPFPIKPSLYLMKVLAAKSKNLDLMDQLMPKELARKGPAYNTALVPFIENKWTPEVARKTLQV